MPQMRLDTYVNCAHKERQVTNESRLNEFRRKFRRLSPKEQFNGDRLKTSGEDGVWNRLKLI